MDEQFKFVINVFAYQLSRKYMTSWHGQIVLIDRYWDILLDSIDFDELTKFFEKVCKAENLQPDDYDLNQALLYARNELRIEMMQLQLLTSSKILQSLTFLTTTR